VFITEVTEAEYHTCGEREDEEVKIIEEGSPGGWLMFGYGGDDRDVSGIMLVKGR